MDENESSVDDDLNNINRKQENLDEKIDMTPMFKIEAARHQTVKRIQEEGEDSPSRFRGGEGQDNFSNHHG